MNAKAIHGVCASDAKSNKKLESRCALKSDIVNELKAMRAIRPCSTLKKSRLV
jgi:hypothetical protein